MGEVLSSVLSLLWKLALTIGFVAIGMTVLNFLSSSHLPRPIPEGNNLLPLNITPEVNYIKPEVNYRLPLNIKPIHYHIHLGPYLKESDANKFTFDGECLIEIQALQNTNQIQLHMENLNVSFARYYKKNESQRFDLPQATPNNLTDIVVYNLEEVLQANVSYFLEFKYVGSINEEMSGFYRSKYTTTNATKWLYATQFEPIQARSVFPSFDEPEFKAKFNLSMTYDPSFESVGPTDVLMKNDSSYHKKRYYKTTPKMPTFLLTFTIYTHFYVRDEGRLAVFARPKYSSQTEYSHECGKKFVAAFRSFFNTSSSTITENVIHLNDVSTSELGEYSLLYDKKESSLRSKQLVTSIVAFEVAQLWWENLVTCRWWSYIWLNKGFATYFQHFGTDLVDSSFNMSSQFVINVVQNIMYQDATSDARPMSNENVRTKSDIIHMFNQISFQKAAAFIRMTKSILGENNFRTSLNEYLTTYAYKNTIPADLFNIWMKYCPDLHKEFFQGYFDSFTTQEGYPVVTFKRISERFVEVSQKRFLLKDFDKANANLKYHVPITFTTSFKNNFQNVSASFFLPANTSFMHLGDNVTWFIVNIQQSGFYRVNYDKNSWKEIGQKLFSESREDIHVLNRAQIVDDALNLAYAGDIEYRVPFYILPYLKNESDYLPLAAALKGLSYLMTRLGNESDIMVPFIREIIKNNYDIVGFTPTKNETTLEIYRRTLILDWACKNIIPECVDQAKLHFDEISKNRSVEVNIRSAVYCTVMREGNETNFDTLYNKYMAETVASEKNLIFEALSCVKDRNLVDRFFEIILSKNSHAVDRTVALYNLCDKNNENVDHVFYLIDENIERLANATGDYQSVASVVLEIAEHFTTQAQLDKLLAFKQKHAHRFGISASLLERAVRVVEMNLRWSSQNLLKIKSILAEIAPI